MKYDKRGLVFALLLLSSVIGSVSYIVIEEGNLQEEKSLTIQTPNPTGSTSSNLYFSTFIGGDVGKEFGRDIAIDSTGASYITGYTRSSDFPTQMAFDETYNGECDAFVTKLNEDGSLNYSTFLGGTNTDYGYSIAVNDEGYCFITGYTFSSDFPVQNAFDSTFNNYKDSFVAKFNPDGSLNFSTFIGGDYWDEAYGIAIDTYGACYITGETYSFDFPTKNAYMDSKSGSTDVFLSKFNADGTLGFSTYFGGEEGDYGESVTVDIFGNCIITGHTNSPNFPILNAYDSSHNLRGDVFIAKFSTSGSLLCSSFIGGSHTDIGKGVATDAAGSIYLTGWTFSPDFPTLNAYDNINNDECDIFVTKFSPSLNLIYSTFIGADNYDYGHDIDVESDGTCYITGYTNRLLEFPSLPTYYRSYHTYPGSEAVLIKFDPGGTLEFSTCIGGRNTDFGYGIAVRNNGQCYLTGTTYSSDFPMHYPLDESLGETGDAYVLKFPTKPLDDPDSDGLPNYWEFHMELNATDPLDAGYDSDSDGLSNLQEFLLGINANRADSDLDVMEDGWEILMGLDPKNQSDAQSDFDLDGLPNLWEFQMELNATDPLDAGYDSDSDGLNNTQEYQLNLNATNPDSDNDELTDGEEHLTYFTNPLDPDTDFDGMYDGWEIIMSLDPLNSSDATLDADLDGLPNLWECQMNLNATDPADSGYDSDTDGLTNLEEYQLGFDARDPDMDDDGLLDGEEHNITGTNPMHPDSDGDGLLDGDEVNYYTTNPLNSDTDGDLMDDFYETHTGLNASDPLDAGYDNDTDGLINLLEYQLGANASMADTDGDLLLDGEEYHLYGTSPTRIDTDFDGLDDYYEIFTSGTSPSNPDTDYDGLFDGQELVWYGSDPLNRDSDGDTMHDGWEHYMGLNPMDANDATLDKDRDGLPNLWEYQMGLDANNAYDADRDLDEDGLTNLWEYQNGFDATDPSDASLDTDQDGLTNLDEFHLGTNPRNPDSDNDGFKDSIDPVPNSFFNPTGFIIIGILGIIGPSAGILIHKLRKKKKTR